MVVHPVVIPGSGTRSWTVLGDDDVPVVPVDRFLAYLTDIGRSPNTVKAYAHDMKDLWEFSRVPGPGLARGPAGGHRRWPRDGPPATPRAATGRVPVPHPIRSRGQISAGNRKPAMNC